MRANALPFDVDQELEAFLQDRDQDSKEEDVAIRLFPVSLQLL